MPGFPQVNFKAAATDAARCRDKPAFRLHRAAHRSFSTARGTDRESRRYDLERRFRRRVQRRIVIFKFTTSQSRRRTSAPTSPSAALASPPSSSTSRATSPNRAARTGTRCSRMRSSISMMRPRCRSETGMRPFSRPTPPFRSCPEISRAPSSPRATSAAENCTTTISSTELCRRRPPRPRPGR